MGGQVAKLNPEHQQLSQGQQNQRLRRSEEHEYEASASASTGINLNIFAALSGVFSGKSKKTTHTDEDGKTHTEEDFEGHQHVKQKGHTSLQAISSANSSVKERHRIADEAMAEDRKMIQGARVQEHQEIEDGKK